MKPIALTMMRSFESGRDEWRNAIDERWVGLLAECGMVPIFLPNHAPSALDLLHSLAPAGLVLTGGGDCAALSGRADARDETEQAALAWAQSANRPVLGVCRGMQVLLAASGVPLAPVEHHVATCHRISTTPTARWVNSYHHFAARTAPSWEIKGRAEDGVVEWVSDPCRRWEGVMWHPEREATPSQHDIELIRNLFSGA